jgi:hypothetical protein
LLCDNRGRGERDGAEKPRAPERERRLVVTLAETRVIGSDVNGLDDDRDGVGCEGAEVRPPEGDTHRHGQQHRRAVAHRSPDNAPTRLT